MPVSFTAPPPPLPDFTFNYNNLTFGVGFPWRALKITGLRDLPPVRTGDQNRPRDHGMFSGLDYLSGRTIVIDLVVTGQSNADFNNNLQLFENAFTPQIQTLLPFVYQLPGQGNRVIMCRTRRRPMPIDVTYQFNISQALAVELFAPDPRLYDATLQSAIVNLPAQLSGMTFPATFPLAFGSGSGAGGLIQAVNAGNFPTRPVATITGPCTNPRIQNQTAGKTLTFNLTLAASDILTVDLDAHSIVLNGTVSRRNTLSAGSQWWQLDPGVTSQVTFGSSDGVATGATLQLSWRSAWL